LAHTNNFKIYYRKTDHAYFNFPEVLHLPGPSTMYLSYHPFAGPDNNARSYLKIFTSLCGVW